MDDDEQFHAHLDDCRQCREQIFNLCPVGDRLLVQAAKTVDDSMLRSLLQWNRAVSRQAPS